MESHERRTVSVITVIIRPSAVHKQLLTRLRSTRWAVRAVLLIACAGCSNPKTARIYAMNGFLKATFTRQKFQGLLLNTALGNFTGYVAGSLVTLTSTRNALEGRAIRNLFGLLPRKKVVVHLLPHWLEWLLALVAGFLVMEAVRYCFNHGSYAAPLSASRPELPTEKDGQASDRSEAAERWGAGSGRGMFR